jgi:hypothetical protein
MGWNSVRDGIRELFFLEKAEEKSAKLTDTQRATMRTYSEAAASRLTVARDIRGTAQTPVALELYRQSSLFYTLAFLSSKDQTLDVATLAPDAAFGKLDQALEANGARAPAELAQVKPLLVSTDPLAPDRLPLDQGEQRAQELELTTQWLSRLFDVRSPRELRVARIIRLSAAGAAALGLLIVFFIWLFAPKDLAKGRPAFASGGAMFSTLPAGAVDGSKSGQYGYHSVLEDSPWLSIDLGKRYALTSVKVYGRGDGYYDQSIPLALEVSDDGTTYRQIAERAEPFSASDPWVIKPAGVVTQYVRLHTLRKSYLVLGEVEVYGHRPR